ncbi:MAG: anthranilate phosphoribosyltransferase [Myxococcota bacterium]|nr:anthranilate phosphoribosyltransferase [Myxococcota bacterium]
MSEDAPLREAIQSVVHGRDLSEDQMSRALGAVMDGHAEAIHIAALLTGLRVKGETTDEILGAARAMRSRATRVEMGEGPLLDTCGTGGDGAGTFNISTAVAFVCAAAGVSVAKHGNRAISSSVGSADVLEALGVRLDLNAEQVRTCIRTVGIGFMFAPLHHSAMRHAGPVRKALGFRSVLNLLGPLTNPAGASHQLIGIYDGSRVGQIAQVLGRLGTRRALVVHGSDGLDEITIAGPTHGALWDGQRAQEITIEPPALGVALQDLSGVAGGDAQHNGAMIRAVLGGATGPGADIVRLNAGAALWVAERADTLEAGVALATDVLSSGAALGKLEELASFSAEQGA